MVDFIICSDLEGKHLDAVEHRFAVDKELLTVPDVVKGDTFLNGVTNTSGVAASDEVGDSAVDAGGGVPHDLGGATVVHGRGPHGEDGVLGVEGTVVEECLMLGHTFSKGNIVVLAPATERVEEKDGVLVALLNELLTGVLQQKHVTVVEGVSDLEGVNGIGALCDDSFLDLSGRKSVLIVTIRKFGSGDEVHGVTTDEEVSLGEDSLGTGVGLGHAAEGTGADLFLAVVEKDWVVDDSNDFVGADRGTRKSDLGLALEFGLLRGSHVLGDGNREEVAFALTVGNGLHVHDLEELKLVHESIQGVGPAITDGLEVLDLVTVDVEGGK